ncbi:MAG TPA: hypothetical protein PKD85_11875 [Saprospiraceae bacterium]|nr:hypothetical protein [Saprospiraceae bacterium]
MKNKSFLLLFVAATFIYSCKRSNQQNSVSNIDELSNYFDAATTGFISVNDDIRFVLKSEIDSNIVKNTDLKKLIKLSPDVDGEVTLLNNNLLIFKPNTPLQAGTVYQISLDFRDLSSSFDKVIIYDLRTKIQDINVANQGFYIREDNRILHTIDVFTADYIDEANLRKCFSNQEDIHSIKAINNTEFEVVFIYEPSKYGKSSIVYNASPIGVDKAGRLAHYDLTDHLSVIEKSFESGSKEAKFIFSKPLIPKQDLTGLIKVNNANARYTIDRNILTVTVDNKEENINLKLFAGIKSIDNSVLKQDFIFNFSNIPPSPEVGFLDDGIYFPSNGDFKIPIKTRNLKAIRVHIVEIKQKNVLQFLTWQSLEYPDQYNLRFFGKPVFDEVVPLNKGKGDTDGYLVHGLDMTQLVKRNQGSIYHVMLDYNIEHVDLVCASALKKHKLESNIPDLEFYNRWEYPFRDYYYYYDEDYGGEYDSRNPCKIEYYQNRQLNAKILICSDYGLIAKKAGNSYFAAVTDLNNATPVSSAEVVFYSLQGEELAKSKTDKDGFVEMQNVPQDLLAVQLSHNNITTYLKMQTYDANDITSFDVTGERTESEVEAFVYTDRGVYRPADTIFLDVILNKPDFTHPNGIPIVVEFYNTDNLLIDKKIQRVDISNNLIYHYVDTNNGQSGSPIIKYSGNKYTIIGIHTGQMSH